MYAPSRGLDLLADAEKEVLARIVDHVDAASPAAGVKLILTLCKSIHQVSQNAMHRIIAITTQAEFKAFEDFTARDSAAAMRCRSIDFYGRLGVTSLAAVYGILLRCPNLRHLGLPYDPGASTRLFLKQLRSMTRLRELHIAVADSGIVDAIEAASADEVLSIRVLDLNFEEADTIGFSSSLTHLTPFLSTLKLCYCVFGDDDSFTSLLDHLEHLRSLILENVTGLTASAIRIALSHHIERLWSLSIENIQVRLPTVGWLDNVLHRFKVLYRCVPPSHRRLS